MPAPNPSQPQSTCDFCGGPLAVIHFDYGIDPECGYRDEGYYIECRDCSFREEL